MLGALQALQYAREHGAQLRAGEVEGQHMRVLGGVAAGTGAAQVGADPQHGHSAKRAFDVMAVEARALERRNAHHGNGVAVVGRGGRQIEPIGTHHTHIHVEHAALHPLGDIGLAFPDVDDQITLIHGAVPFFPGTARDVSFNTPVGLNCSRPREVPHLHSRSAGPMSSTRAPAGSRAR
ncbi:hypothetical protein D3C78_1436470 [compost metagenome]